MRKKILITLGMLCLFLLTSSVANAEIKKITIAPCEFIPEEHGEKQLKIGYFGAYIYRDVFAEESLFYAPVHIPDGVIIKWVRLHFWDQRAENIECRLYRANKFTETWEIIYVVFSSGNESGVRHTTKLVPYCTACTLTNIGVCNYYVTINYNNAFNASLRVQGITIGYEESP